MRRRPKADGRTFTRPGQRFRIRRYSTGWPRKDGRLCHKVCHFPRPGRELGADASTALGRTAVKMAELLMNSAIPSEGSMRTSWPALRNPCCANEITKHGGKGEWQTSVQSLPYEFSRHTERPTRSAANKVLAESIGEPRQLFNGVGITYTSGWVGSIRRFGVGDANSPVSPWSEP